MSVFISADDLKVKIVGWLLKSLAVEDMLVTTCIENRMFEREVDKTAASAAESAVDSYARDQEREKQPIRADDIEGLDEFMQDGFGTRDFEKAVYAAMDGNVKAEDISNLSSFIRNEMDDTVVDRFIDNLGETQIEELRKKLMVAA